MKVAQSYLTLRPRGLYCPWNVPGQSTEVGSLSLPKGSSQTRVRTQVSLIAGEFFTSNTGMGSLTLLQQISATQESNQGLLHFR